LAGPVRFADEARAVDAFLFAAGFRFAPGAFRLIAAM
jgi:hypothetical protein